MKNTMINKIFWIFLISLIALTLALPASAGIPIKLKLTAEPSNIMVGQKSTIIIKLLNETDKLVATEFAIPINISANLGNFPSTIIMPKGSHSYSKEFTSEISGIAVISVNSKGLIGDTTSIAVIPVPSISYGGGSGSGGVSTSEPFENIEKAERHDKTLFADKPVTYTFTASEHGVSEIIVTGEENEYDIALRIEALKGTSKLVSTSPPEVVYKYMNVWAGTKRIKEALIRFKVENSWLGSNNIASGKVKMVRWDSGKWVQLDTTQSTKDNSYTYYEAKTGGFSVFAIVGLKEGEVVPTWAEATPTPVTTQAGEMTPTPEATEEKKGFLPGFEVLAAILAVTGALYLRNKERR